MHIQTITLKIFSPGNKKADTQRIVAGPGRHFTAANIETILAKVGEKVDAEFPDQYRLVAIGPAAFNFVRTDTDIIPAK